VVAARRARARRPFGGGFGRRCRHHREVRPDRRSALSAWRAPRWGRSQWYYDLGFLVPVETDVHDNDTATATPAPGADAPRAGTADGAGAATVTAERLPASLMLAATVVGKVARQAAVWSWKTALAVGVAVAAAVRRWGPPTAQALGTAARAFTAGTARAGRWTVRMVRRHGPGLWAGAVAFNRAGGRLVDDLSDWLHVGRRRRGPRSAPHGRGGRRRDCRRRWWSTSAGRLVLAWLVG
jgi:hypothetical protein